MVNDLDMGHVGEVEEINTEIIDAVEKAGFVAVIAPSGVGDDGLTYNINADTVAAGIAQPARAWKSSSS
ncbi:MAG: hypothetical protein MZV70_73235 [Desulfobacterales bacterium]|nr:hypothetical protein [Desulfobacterales bacterium]